MKPGEWFLFKLDGSDFTADGHPIWQTLQIGPTRGDRLRLYTTIRIGGRHRRPLAEFTREYGNTKDLRLSLFPLLRGKILAPGNDGTDYSGSEELVIGGKLYKCRRYERREKNGDVLIYRFAARFPFDCPIKISQRAHRGGEKNILTLVDRGGAASFPPTARPFKVEHHNTAAEVRVLNGGTWNRYCKTLRDVVENRGYSMEGIILEPGRAEIINFEAMLDSLLSARAIFIGEKHDSADCHRMQIDVIRALRERESDISVGMEMFYRTPEIQETLDSFIAGRLTESEFRRRAYNPSWSAEWYELYRPIFLLARERGIPLVGLNCPRELMDKFKAHPERLTPVERVGFADTVDYNDVRHRRITLGNFQGMMGVMGMGMDVEWFYRGQCVWDDTMAESIVLHLNRHPGRKMVICAGSLHVGYDVTLPGRCRKRAVAEGITLETKTLFPHQSSWFPTSSWEELHHLKIADYIYFIPEIIEKPDLSGSKKEEDWEKAYRFFLDGDLEKAATLLKKDNSDFARKILRRVVIVERARELARAGECERARSLILRLPEPYAFIKDRQLLAINAGQKTGVRSQD